MAVNERIEMLLSRIGIPFTYREFKPYKNKPAPNPPYLVYLIDNEKGFGADGKNLIMRKHITVELYSDTKNILIEEMVEDSISEYEFEKYEDYIKEEKMFCISYEFDIYEKLRRGKNGK